MKKRIVLSIVVIIVIVGMVYLIDQAKYTTIGQEISKVIRDSDVVKISINRESDDARISITNQEDIEAIVTDLSRAELKEVKDFSTEREYAIRMFSNPDVGQIGFEVTADQKYIVIFKNTGHTKYEVINANDYLHTIEKLELISDR